jgi:hypothetical protein
LRRWAETLGVAPGRLKEAIWAVGNHADKVQEYLKTGSVELSLVSEAEHAKHASGR